MCPAYFTCEEGLRDGYPIRMAKPSESKKSRIETTLAFMMAGVIGVSILAILVVLIAYLMNIREMPPVLALLPMIGLPLGALLMIALLSFQAFSRAKEKR